MLIKEIVIIHKSLIVRKGLSAVLEAYGRPATKVSPDFNEKETASFVKSIIFSDVSFKERMSGMFLKSEASRNVFAGIGKPEAGRKNNSPYKIIIDINDSREKLFSKLDVLFPSTSVYTAGNGSILTARETEILKLVAKGYRSRDIAARLFISRHTVITHRKNICGKLGIKTPSGLTLFALVNKLI